MKGKDIKKNFISGDNIICQEDIGLKFYKEKWLERCVYDDI